MKNSGKIILTRVLFLFIAGFFLFGGINAVLNGKFSAGGMRGLRGKEVLRVDEPLQFWIGVGVVLILGIVALWTALRRK
jgi:hypothetical protein